MLKTCLSFVVHKSHTLRTAFSSAATAVRPFEAIPRVSLLTLTRQTLPGGKYYKTEMSKLQVALRRDYGDLFCLPVPLRDPHMLISHDPKDFRTVFRHEGVWPERLGSEAFHYYRQHHRKEFFQGVEGLMATQGKAWGDFRAAVNPALMRPKNVHFYLERITQVNDEFVELIRTLRDPTTHEMPANFEYYINRWALESVAVIALDKHLGLLNRHKVDAAVDSLLVSIGDFFKESAHLELNIPIWRYITTPTLRKYFKTLDNIREITSKFVNEAAAKLEHGTRPEHEQSVLEKVWRIDKKIAEVIAMDMLLAGVDTTTSTLTGVLLCLAKNPAKQAQLRAELLKLLPYTYKKLSAEAVGLPYLRACIKESMRLHPLVLANSRRVQHDCVLSGYHVPKGTNVVMFLDALNRDARYYKHPDEFLPERWLRTDAHNELQVAERFAYMPFGLGPRMCVGKRIAELELNVAIINILCNFHVQFDYPTEQAFKNVLINVPNIPLHFKFVDI